MSQPVEDDWVLDEAGALLDRDGRRERLDLVAADLHSGTVTPVDQATARPDRAAHPGPPHPVTWPASPHARVGTTSAGRARATPGTCPPRPATPSTRWSGWPRPDSTTDG